MMNNTGKHIVEHEHPLIFNDEVNLDSDDIKPKFCSICGLIFFINSYYSCSRIEQGCHFLVHQQCARLPKELRVALWNNPSQYDDTLKFSLGGPKDPVIANDKCIKCEEICKNYTYSNWLGHIHPWCGVPLEIVTKHSSHGHPLSPTRREICGVCNACGEEERGIFLSCQTCDYWISQDCALLPPVAIHASHSHPYLLVYNNLDIERPLTLLGSLNCDICGGSIGYKCFYNCSICRHYVHIKCIKSSIKNITPEETRKYIVHLPAANKEDTVFSSFIANLEQVEEVDATSTSITMPTTEAFHEHQLIFHGTTVGDEAVDDMEEGQIRGSKALCNACINPINSSTPYYSCSVAQCHFLVHEFCAMLPSRIKNKYFDSSTWFLFTKRKEFFSVFCCHFCRYDCNGFGYSTESESSSKGMCVDVECASAPRIIKHESHKNHYLELYRYDVLFFIQTECCFTTHLSLCYYGCHDHPVTSVRMLTIGSQSCTYCKNIIQGFEDDWAFHCEPCDVWIHKYCAEESTEKAQLRK